MTSCVICTITLKRGQTDTVSCVTCNSFFHLKCIPLKQEDTDYLKYIKKTWSCKNCLNKPKSNSASSLPVLPSSPSTKSTDINLILNKIEALSLGQSKLIELVNEQNKKLDSFEQKLSALSSQLLSIKEENILLRNNLTTLTKRVESLETNQPTLCENSFSDFIDQQARSKNIILFNVTEKPDDSNDSDMSTTNLILQKLNVDIKPVTVHRLGRPNGKPRPLKATLNTTSDVFKILGSSRRLKSDQIFNEVRIISDKTPKQREYFQNLRKELDARRLNGESNLSIKYYKGVPSIISSAAQKN